MRDAVRSGRRRTVGACTAGRGYDMPGAAGCVGIVCGGIVESEAGGTTAGGFVRICSTDGLADADGPQLSHAGAQAWAGG